MCSVPRCTSSEATGPRPGSRRDSMTVPEASGLGLAVGSASASATSRTVSSSVSMPVRSSAETCTNSCVPPQSEGITSRWESSCLTRSGLAPGLSILLTATMNGTSAARSVVDRLDRLRHDAVVGGHHDHRDVGDLGAAGAHGGERLVARGVEEGDLAAVVVHLVGADVLGDAAGLAGRDLGRADRVEERRLAVVNVAHHRDHRRARDQVLVGVVELLGPLGLLLGVDDGRPCAPSPPRSARSRRRRATA